MTKSDDIIERIAKGIHDGTIKKGDLVDPELLKYVADHLLDGVDIGFNTDLKTHESIENTRNLFKAMETNVYQFSGFKTAAQIKEVKSLLHGANGEVRPFKEFKADVLAIDQTYNKTWLKTEYDTAVSGAESGRKWLQIKAEKEVLPYLQYETMEDSRVRPEHADLDKIIRRVDDPFWDENYPPNGWNCRCTVRQLADATETAMDDIDMADVPPAWRENSGETGAVLKDDVYRSAFSKAEQATITKETMKLMG
jgi:SPP1 gp7 family putative phage head morphogenesis protein